MGQKLSKGESLYKPELAERATELIFLVQLVDSKGNLQYGKLAKLLEVPVRTFNSWRNPESEYYKPEFDKALKKANIDIVEAIDAGEIKRAMIKRAKPYTRVKKTKELKTIGPDMPAMSIMKKPDLIAEAKKLKIKLGKKENVNSLKVKIAQAVEKQTEEKLIVVKQEEEQMHGDVAAAKFVLPNIGPKDKRWIGQEKLEVEGKSMADIVAIMCGKKKKKRREAG